MAGISRFRGWLGLIGEVDLRPIRAEAEQSLEIAIVTKDIETGEYLAEQLRIDPDRPGRDANTPVVIFSPAQLSAALTADLLILVLDENEYEAIYQADILQKWRTAGKRVIVIINESLQVSAESTKEQRVIPTAGGRLARIISGSVYNQDFIHNLLIPPVLAIMPERQLALARNFPLFRGEVARRLINDTSASNAAYSLTTGLAEIIPILTIPLNIADMIILTKAQAFLVYRLGLALGMPLEWQSYLTEFGGVLGAGFFWRQIARMMVGFIPAYGIIPKVAVSYSGTYVVGQVVYQWYLTGRHLSGNRIRSLYTETLQNGRLLAANLFARRLSLPKLRRKQQTAKSASKEPTEPLPKERFNFRKDSRTSSRQERICTKCGKTSRIDAVFCQYCGTPFSIEQKSLNDSN